MFNKNCIAGKVFINKIKFIIWAKKQCNSKCSRFICRKTNTIENFHVVNDHQATEEMDIKVTISASIQENNEEAQEGIITEKSTVPSEDLAVTIQV